MAAPRSPDWGSDVASQIESEGESSFHQYENNVESLALNVLGQNWSGEQISVFLEDWELARVALSWRIALDLLCQELHEAWWLVGCCLKSPLSQYAKAILSPWTGCNGKERSVVRELSVAG